MSQPKSSGKKKPAAGAGQATMFSFFAKAPAKPAGSSPAPQTVKKSSLVGSSSKSTPATVKSTPCSAKPSSSKAKVTPANKPKSVTSGGSGSAVAGSSAGSELIGQSIEVWWEDDSKWNLATVSAYNSSNCKHTLDYTGGDTEHVVLSKQRWRRPASAEPASAITTTAAPAAAAAAIVTADVDAMDTEEEDEEIIRKPVARSGSSKPKRRVIDSDDEAELDDAPRATASAAVAASGKKVAAAADSDGGDATWQQADDSSDEEQEADDDDSDASADSDSGVTPAKKAGKRSKKQSTGSKRLRKSSGGFAIVETKTPVQSAGRKKAAKALPSATPAGGAASSKANKVRPSSNLFGGTPSPTANGGAKTPGTAGSSSAAAAAGDGEAGGDSGADGSQSPSSAVPKIVLPEGVIGSGGHVHDRLDWLKPGIRQDANRRKEGHPEYNPRTIFVPPAFLAKETAAMQQWWELKSQNMDTVLFFKVGKFYELFHMDSDIGMRELDLIYMKGEKGHSGFPEISYSKFADQLVEKGYRVARVEQTETPEMLKLRNETRGKGTGKTKEKVVRRELCSVVSKGTRTFCFMDSAYRAPDGSPSSAACVLAVVERPVTASAAAAAAAVSSQDSAAEDAMDIEGAGSEYESDAPPAAVCEYGVCLVDAANATFQLGQFADTAARSRLRTLLAQSPPAEVVHEVRGLSDTTTHLLKCMAPTALVQQLRSGDEFWGPVQTIKQLKAGQYFAPNTAAAGSKTAAPSTTVTDDDANGGPGDRWPEVLAAVVQGGQDAELALSAFGAALWHLKRSLIDHDLVSMRRFSAYIPPDVECDSSGDVTDAFAAAVAAAGSTADAAADAAAPQKQHMVLDGTALANLEVLRNSYDNTEKGSLWAYMNRCSTAFGRRLLKEWLCKPLMSVKHINGRLDAVEELCTELAPEADQLRKVLKGLPDIERLLARVHSMASLHRAQEHPESRAIMYEGDKHGKRKIDDFCSVLDGLEAACKLPRVVQDREPSSALLHSCLTVQQSGNKGLYPDMCEDIQWFRSAFDADQAKKDKTIKPRAAVDEAYDSTVAAIAAIKVELEDHLTELKSTLRCSSIKYFHAAKERYQLELPEANRVPDDFDLRSKKKGYRRFWSPFVTEKLKELADAEAALVEGQRDQMRRLFAKFDEHRDMWAAAVSCISHLDALLSLAAVSSEAGFCRPVFKEEGGGPKGVSPFIKLQAARHPCLAQTYQGGEFIPNDTTLGPVPSDVAATFSTDGSGDVMDVDGSSGSGSSSSSAKTPRMLLLSGPNMGGKSTLLRQTCLVAIMAQMGCFVPAEAAALTPVDRIFTRVGASDRILAGQSTFYVELSETATVLHHATARSLVILDELGRGTSTFDGTAIAHAVLSYLVKKAKCLAMFATHYHSLVEEWGSHPEVFNGHMDCLVDNEGGKEQRVTFLYTLAPGPCPKSFGINVARLAQLPEEVLETAARKSQEFEQALQRQSTPAAATTAAAAAAVDAKSELALKLLALLETAEVNESAAAAGLAALWQEAQALQS